MLQCSNCGSKQDEGKFCGSCGGELTEATHEEEPVVKVEQSDDAQQVEEEISATEAPTESQSNEVVDQVLDASKDFSAYFTEYIKGPSRIFAKLESEVKNGIISLSIIAILIALTFAKLASNFLAPLREEILYYEGVTEGIPSFLSVFGTSLLFIVPAILVTLALLFIINKLFGTDYTFKEMTSVFGAHMLPVIVISVLAFLLVLVKSNTAGSIFLFVAIGLIITTIPIYLISSLLTKQSKGLDPLYGYLLYLVSVGISFTVLFGIFVDSALGNLVKTIQSW